MQEARDLFELQELIAQLGLTDDKRDSPRYKVNIPGNYYVEEGDRHKSLCSCRLVDVSKRGASIEIVKISFHLGAILHLLLPKGDNIQDAIGKVIYINRTDSGYKVGLQSISEEDNIVTQLLS